MFPEIKEYCNRLVSSFTEISEERQAVLLKISEYIKLKQNQSKPIKLIYICTHNSRRSHFGQIWAAVAVNYFSIKNVETYSGGTEATAFNINAINALKKIGFKVSGNENDKNPIYKMAFGENEYINCFSKVFDDKINPKTEFAAIMTCSDAEENCPFVPGTELRIATTYNDPKAFDGTPQQDEKYLERCRQIAIETLFVFSRV